MPVADAFKSDTAAETVPSNSIPKMRQTKSVYHGTHSACRSQIQAEGVTSNRASKIVYVTDVLDVARYYAKVWTFGMYAIGRVPTLTGIVVHATVPAELVTPVPLHSKDYLMIQGSIRPEWVERIEDFDVSQGYDDPKSRWKRLSEMDSLLHWPVDRIEGRDDLLDLIPLLEVQIEQAKIEAARRGTPITLEDLLTFGPD